MAYFKIPGPADAPTVDVEIPTKNGPLQLRLPRQDYIPREKLQNAQRRMVELNEDMKAQRDAIIKDGGIVWEVDPDMQFPDDRVFIKLLFEEVFPDNPEYAAAIDDLETGVVTALRDYWQKQSAVELGKSGASSTSSTRKRASKTR